MTLYFKGRWALGALSRVYDCVGQFFNAFEKVFFSLYMVEIRISDRLCVSYCVIAKKKINTMKVKDNKTCSLSKSIISRDNNWVTPKLLQM